jgi:uncharacterized protein YcaQ
MTTNKSSFDQALANYRLKTFNTAPGKRVTTLQAAVEFVNQRGFVTFWPIKNVDLPSLWTAVAGDRVVADEHDDPGHVTWGWKDQMLDQKVWYYGKLLRGKASMVSLDIIHYFYALSPRVADLDDFKLEYEAGRLTRPALDVAEALLINGPTHSIELRQLARLSGKASKYPFERALVELQKGMWILPVGVAEAGGWRYSFIYELFDRWYPQVWQDAQGIKRAQARARLVDLYLKSVGAAEAVRIQRLFSWTRDETMQTLEQLLQSGKIGKLRDGRWVTGSLLAEAEAHKAGNSS